MKVVGTPLLKKMVARARARGLNRQMSKGTEKQLDPNGSHVLSQPLVHGDVQCIRATVVLCKMKGRDEPYQGVLDFTFDDWNAVPERD